ncbi:hypothetical protein [Tautonia marina]|uniref:hypothetical protein n=1 Tax=Tautonia marina TaxID=2653855 RepID=UPI0012603EAB|nr:hypothetical protein [Tautonia marina]
MIWRFVGPNREGELEDHEITASSLPEAIEALKATHWKPGLCCSYAVWHDYALVAHVYEGLMLDTGKYDLYWVRVPPSILPATWPRNPSDN